MRKKNVAVILMTAIMVMAFSPGALSNDADVLEIGHDDVFGTLRRPPVDFPHDLHMDVLECGACHHSWDKTAGKLVYIEGEEQNCYECHQAEKSDGMPALRQAYHGSCTACHRKMIKSKQLPTGPTTCGECHLNDEQPARA